MQRSSFGIARSSCCNDDGRAEMGILKGIVCEEDKEARENNAITFFSDSRARRYDALITSRRVLERHLRFDSHATRVSFTLFPLSACIFDRARVYAVPWHCTEFRCRGKSILNQNWYNRISVTIKRFRDGRFGLSVFDRNNQVTHRGEETSLLLI